MLQKEGATRVKTSTALERLIQENKMAYTVGQLGIVRFIKSFPLLFYQFLT